MIGGRRTRGDDVLTRLRVPEREDNDNEHPLLRLQRLAGNRATTTMLQRSCACGPRCRCEGPADEDASPVQRIPVQRAPLRDAKGDVSIVCDDDSGMQVEASSLADKVIQAQDPDDFVAKVKALAGPIRNLYIFSHSTDEGVIIFGRKGKTARTTLGELAAKLKGSGTLCPRSISFRGCRIGQADTGLEAFRASLGAAEATGQTCFVVAQELGAITVDRKPIVSEDQLKNPAIKDVFDDQFKAVVTGGFTSTNGRDIADGFVPLKKGQPAKDNIPLLQETYFHNNGKLVSVWSNKAHATDFFPATSVFVKDLEDKSVLGCGLKRVKPPTPERCVTPTPPTKLGFVPISFARNGGGARARAALGPEPDPGLVGLQKGDGLVFGTFERRGRVRKLQVRLNEHGAATAVDGFFGKGTAAALHNAQIAAALPASDVVDEATAALLAARGAGSEVTGIVGLARGAGIGAQASSRPNVARLQQLLTDNGVPTDVDGKFGPGTGRTLMSFQLSRELEPAEFVDQATADALEAGPPELICPDPNPPITVEV